MVYTITPHIHPKDYLPRLDALVAFASEFATTLRILEADHPAWHDQLVVDFRLLRLAALPLASLSQNALVFFARRTAIACANATLALDSVLQRALDCLRRREYEPAVRNLQSVDQLAFECRRLLTEVVRENSHPDAETELCPLQLPSRKSTVEPLQDLLNEVARSPIEDADEAARQSLHLYLLAFFVHTVEPDSIGPYVHRLIRLHGELTSRCLGRPAVLGRRHANQLAVIARSIEPR